MTPLLLLLACGTPSAPTPAPAPASTEAAPAAQPGESDVVALQAKLGQVPVVDVRTDAEFQSGHVPGAIHIPLDQLETRLAELEPYRAGDLYLICEVGGRSARAASLLADRGFQRPINVVGGTRAWRDAGYPTE